MTSSPAWLDRARNSWRYRGAERPSFAVAPGPDQESVWDYPRPPVLETDTRSVIVRVADLVLARTTRAIRVLETASPPTFYIPSEDVHTDGLEVCPGRSACEWKGIARYWSVRGDDVFVRQAAWSYPEPLRGFEEIRDHVSFYPGRVECYVDEERVRQQPGGFYGGWLTKEIVGPVKGDPGSGGW